MAQIRCKYLLLSFFCVSGAFGAEAITLSCDILDGESKIPLRLKLKKADVPAATDDDTAVEWPQLSVELQEKVASEVTLKGFYQSYTKNRLDLERLDYQPLGLLGLGESDVDEATFYYAKEKEISNDYELSLVSIRKKDAEGNKVEAGVYGSYLSRNVLCPPSSGNAL